MTHTKNTEKLNTLRSIELIFKNKIDEYNMSRPKYFVTFPIPYMNGKLHLGHLYSLSKAEFLARYKYMAGFDVFFPFAFHGTGMPISASSKKLAEGDKDTIELLKSIGITDIEPFKNPQHWLFYFPGLAIDVLKKFHSYINWNHSFITTDINPFYDSFVRWQFNKMKAYISYGKKETIFCTKTNQPCLDHDRRTGEGVVPVAVKMAMIKTDGLYFCTRIKHTTETQHFEADSQKKIITLGRLTRLLKVIVDSKTCVMDYWAVENIKHQKKATVVLGSFNIANIVFNSDVQLVLVDGDESPSINCIDNDMPLLTYFEPEQEVISRAGSRCVVALVDQWFLNYDDENWKIKAKLCIEQMDCTPETHKMLLEAVDWIDRWGFSRTFGLGTSYEGFVIDSLSDSTVYMAFYLVKQEMFSDIYGHRCLFDTKMLTNEVWDYVFGFTDKNVFSDEKELVLERARTSFKRYYPVDIRVSGKDLIKNHLIFYIFHHVALFPADMWPKKIYTNGHLLLNNAKMSKSEGNFLTGEDAIGLFGVNVVRITLADAGDFNEDANFSYSLADSYALKMHTMVNYFESFAKKIIEKHKTKENMRAVFEKKIEAFVQSYETYKKQVGSGRNMQFGDELLKEGTDFLVEKCRKSFEAMIYRDVVKYGFHEFKTLIDLCTSLNCSENAVLYAMKNNLLVIYPIIPSISDYLLEKYFVKDIIWPSVSVEKNNIYGGMEWFRKFSRNLANKLARSRRKNVRIYIGDKLPEWKVQVEDIDPNDIHALNQFFAKFAIKPNKGMSYIKDRVHYYFDEKKLLIGLKENLSQKLKTSIEIICDVQNKGEPYVPYVEFY